MADKQSSPTGIVAKVIGFFAAVGGSTFAASLGPDHIGVSVDIIYMISVTVGVVGWLIGALAAYPIKTITIQLLKTIASLAVYVLLFSFLAVEYGSIRDSLVVTYTDFTQTDTPEVKTRIGVELRQSANEEMVAHHYTVRQLIEHHNGHVGELYSDDSIAKGKNLTWFLYVVTLLFGTAGVSFATMLYDKISPSDSKKDKPAANQSGT